jgi:putative membrane protein
MYEGYHVAGMHLIWWFIWSCMLLWIFTMPYAIPGQRWKRNASLDLLKNRFAAGQISAEEYAERKKVLMFD